MKSTTSQSNERTSSREDKKIRAASVSGKRECQIYTRGQGK